MGCTDVDEDNKYSVCNGRGECTGPNETCICEIKFTGENCSKYNSTYLVSISSVFYVVAFISLIQLLICCFAEYKRLKQPSFFKAFRITTQKFLYFVVFIAALLRATYFANPEVQPSWSYYLMSAYYPLLMTCASLIVCFWAEVSATDWILLKICAFSFRNDLTLTGWTSWIWTWKTVKNLDFFLFQSC